MGGRQFTSTFPGLLDSKSRVCVPAPFRQVLEQQETVGIYLFQPVLDPVIECFGQKYFDDVQDRYEKIDPLNSMACSADDLYDFRHFNAHTTLLPLDANGRVRLPDELIGYAGLSEKIVFVGCGKTFQICTPEQARKLDEEQQAFIRARNQALLARRQAEIAAMLAAASASGETK